MGASAPPSMGASAGLHGGFIGGFMGALARLRGGFTGGFIMCVGDLAVAQYKMVIEWARSAQGIFCALICLQICLHAQPTSLEEIWIYIPSKAQSVVQRLC